jgi:hypothetical protein
VAAAVNSCLVAPKHNIVIRCTAKTAFRYSVTVVSTSPVNGRKKELIVGGAIRPLTTAPGETQLEFTHSAKVNKV